MNRFFILLLVFFCQNAKADWFESIQCETNIHIKSKNEDGKLQNINKNQFSLLKKESILIKGFSKENKLIVMVYPWEGIHFSTPKYVKVKKKETDKNSFLALELSMEKDLYNIYCRKSY